MLILDSYILLVPNNLKLLCVTEELILCPKFRKKVKGTVLIKFGGELRVIQLSV